jgi:hypothetical protein
MKFSPLTRRFGALAILGVVVWLLWATLVSPVSTRLAADRQDLAQAQDRLARYNRLAESIPAMQRRLAELKAAHAGQQIFLEGEDPTLLSAQFQQSVQHLISSSGAELGSSQTIAAHQERQFLRIGLQLELTTSAAGLQHLLHDIETASPLIVVNRLAVRVPESGIVIAEGRDGQPGLSIGLELASYAQPHSKSPLQ